MTTHDADIWMKGKAVINSCTTYNQIEVARRFVELAARSLDSDKTDRDLIIDGWHLDLRANLSHLSTRRLYA